MLELAGRSNRSTYLMLVNGCLGNLQFVHLILGTSTGFAEEWEVRYVEVTDLVTKTSWYFGGTSQMLSSSPNKPNAVLLTRRHDPVK
ncbi:hypothetical protein NP493_460g04042 [Ridgeia piscesae]|uniref:Uncharacterized protein n=1 Tax=Ridgeia piscesae TaxID=27915 RepID=A0AAD9KYJ4_RIDPI|nr:hypothetical protein NP493_460g04042 [Ridgeia piscesae]